MRKSKFTESQVVAILADGESGLALGDVCRKHGISNATYYQWKRNYAGVSANELKRIKDLEAENDNFKRMPAVLV
jgi:putative transposase